MPTPEPPHASTPDSTEFPDGTGVEAQATTRAGVLAQEQARRRRRATVVLSTALVGLVVATGLALAAIARAANHDQGQAPSLAATTRATPTTPLVAPATSAPATPSTTARATATTPRRTASPTSPPPASRVATPSPTASTPTLTTPTTAPTAAVPSVVSAVQSLRSAPARSPERVTLATSSGGTSCAGTGRGSGYGAYPGAACRTWQVVYGLTTRARLSTGIHTVACQRDLRTANLVFKAGQTNTWWAWLRSDAGTWDWYPETAFAQGAPDSPLARVALCP